MAIDMEDVLEEVKNRYNMKVIQEGKKLLENRF